jgi:hypothetical protein
MKENLVPRSRDQDCAEPARQNCLHRFAPLGGSLLRADLGKCRSNPCDILYECIVSLTGRELVDRRRRCHINRRRAAPREGIVRHCQTKLNGVLSE